MLIDLIRRVRIERGEGRIHEGGDGKKENSTGRKKYAKKRRSEEDLLREALNH